MKSDPPDPFAPRRGFVAAVGDAMRAAWWWVSTLCFRLATAAGITHLDQVILDNDSTSYFTVAHWIGTNQLPPAGTYVAPLCRLATA